MKINYQKILRENMQNVLKDILNYIAKNGLQDGHHLYITFKTNDKKSSIPDWLKKKFQSEMTIVIQYEYWNFKINQKTFNISLSFDDIKTNLNISFDSIISFADPYANFGLKLIHKNNEVPLKEKNSKKIEKKNNIIEFKTFKKD